MRYLTIGAARGWCPGNAECVKEGSDRLTAILTLLIGLLSYGVMSVVSGIPGLFFLFWLPAVIQLAAGLKLGPVRGPAAAVIGSYVAAAFFYGGWGPIAFTNYAVVGGFVISVMPRLLLHFLRIDPLRNANVQPIDRISLGLPFFLAAAILFGLSPLVWDSAPLAYILASLLLLIVGYSVAARFLGRRNTLLVILVFVLSFSGSLMIGLLTGNAATVPILENSWLPYSLWGTGFGLFGLYFGISSEFAACKSQFQRRIVPALLAVMLVVSAIFSFHQFSSSRYTSLWSDSRDYVDMAALGPMSREFWTGGKKLYPRPPVYPLFIRSLNIDLTPLLSLLHRLKRWSYLSSNIVNRVALAQFLLSIGCWSFLAIALFFTAGSRLTGLIAATSVMLLSQFPDIVNAYRAIMNESLSFSLFVGAGAAAVFFIAHRESRWIVVGTIFAALYGLTRDAGAYEVLFAGTLILALTFFYSRRENIGSRTTVHLIVASAFLIASFVFSDVTANIGKRWLSPFYNVMSERVLVNHKETVWFAEHGMPVNASLMNCAGRKMSNGDIKTLAYNPDPGLFAFRKWARAKGKQVYEEWLLTHLPLTVFRPLEAFPLILSYHIGQIQPIGFHSVILAPWNFGTPEFIVLLLFLGVSVFTTMRSGSPAARRKVCLSTALLLLTVPLFVIIWQGDTNAIARHLSDAGIQFKVGLILTFFFSLDTVTASISKHITHLRSLRLRSLVRAKSKSPVS